MFRRLFEPIPDRLGHLSGWVHYVLHGPTPEPEVGTRPVAQLVHKHVWGPCRWNGQYWYARCVVFESCTGRIAC